MMAFDADDPATDNAALRYNIIRQSPDSPSSNMFYIDAEKGDIVTAISPELLDREVGWIANCACLNCCLAVLFYKRSTGCHLHVSNAASEQSLWEDCFQVTRRRCQISVSPFPRLTEARQRDDCFFSRVTNARTLIGFAGGRGILAVVRHLAHSLIEVIHTHPPALVVSNKPGWKPPIRNCWNHGG